MEHLDLKLGKLILTSRPWKQHRSQGETCKGESSCIRDPAGKSRDTGGGGRETGAEPVWGQSVPGSRSDGGSPAPDRESHASSSLIPRPFTPTGTKQLSEFYTNIVFLHLVHELWIHCEVLIMDILLIANQLKVKMLITI